MRTRCLPPEKRSFGWFVAFIGLGLITAAVGEIQFSIFIRGDVQNFIGSVVFNSFYLAAVALISKWLMAVLGAGRFTLLLHLLLFGTSGLMIEWFMIGNSPWAKPDASQVGMFAYWSCMVLVPFVCLQSGSELEKLKHIIFKSVLIYVGLACVVQGVPNALFHFIYHIWAVILGYSYLAILCVTGYWRALGRREESLEKPA